MKYLGGRHGEGKEVSPDYERPAYHAREFQLSPHRKWGATEGGQTFRDM